MFRAGQLLASTHASSSGTERFLVQTSQSIIEKSRHTILPTIIIELSLLITESPLFINRRVEPPSDLVKNSERRFYSSRIVVTLTWGHRPQFEKRSFFSSFPFEDWALLFIFQLRRESAILRMKLSTGPS